MNFWLHNWSLNRQAHSRTIQIIEVKHNLQKVYDDLKLKISTMSSDEKLALVKKLGEN